MTERIVSPSKIKFLILIFLLLYLIFPIISWQRLLADFEVGFLHAGDVINNKGTKFLINEEYWNSFLNIHPPLYIYSLAAVFKILGPTAAAARFLGFVCMVINAILVYLIFKEIFGKEKEIPAILASLFYISNPLVIQGSLFLDIDNTILTLQMMLFTLLYLKCQEGASLKQLFFLGILFCLILWSKVTTSLVIIATVFLFQIFTGKIKKGFYHAFVIFTAGLGLFVLTMWIYCIINHNFYFSNYLFAPLLMAQGKKLSGTASFQLLTVFKILARLTLWLSPFIALLAFTGIVRAIKTIKKDNTQGIVFLLIYSSIIFFVYLYVGGSHIFPKYHMPIMPVLAILVVGALPFEFENIKIKHFLFSLGAIFVMAMYYIYLVGDPLLSSNYLLKNAIIGGTVLTSGIVRKNIVQMILYFLPLISILFFSFIGKQKFSLYKIYIYLLLILSLASNLALNVLQAKSGYNHMDHYGVKEAETKQVLKFITENVKPNQEIFAPVDINYFLGHLKFIYTDIDTLSYPEKFMIRLRDKDIKCFVIRITSISLQQISNVLRNSAVSENLKRDFLYYDFGSYFVWLRKKN